MRNREGACSSGAISSSAPSQIWTDVSAVPGACQRPSMRRPGGASPPVAPSSPPSASSPPPSAAARSATVRPSETGVDLDGALGAVATMPDPHADERVVEAPRRARAAVASAQTVSSAVTPACSSAAMKAECSPRASHRARRLGRNLRLPEHPEPIGPSTLPRRAFDACAYRADHPLRSLPLPGEDHRELLHLRLGHHEHVPCHPNLLSVTITSVPVTHSPRAAPRSE